MKLSTRLYLSVLLLLPALFSGCIKEDQSDCPTGLEVYFTWEPASYARTGLEPSEVDKIDLFIFDQAGILRGLWKDERPALSRDYCITLPSQNEGNYRFIAWCDVHDCYYTDPTDFVVGQTTFDEAVLLLDHLSGEVTGGVPPLFHADKTELLDPSREQKVYMPLIQAYNTINLTTEGLSQGDNYRMTIYDNNGKYKFDYSFAQDGDFKYTTSCTKDEHGQLAASLNILKLADDRHPVFEIYNVTRDKVMHSTDLVMLLNKINSIDYGRIHTFDIHIKFTTDMTAAIYINGWQVTEDDILLY